MKKGIPCFDNSVIGLKDQNRITFCFASGNEDIMPEITVSLGDMNPLTGEKITDLTFFREYHLLRNRQIYYNKKAVSAPLSGKEKELRQALRQKIASDFVREYGYMPNNSTLNWLVQEKYPRQYRLELDSCYTEEGEYRGDCVAEFADPEAEKAFRKVEEEGHTLDDFEGTLSLFQQDVFRMLRMASEGIRVRGMGKQLAEKWGVDQSDISHAKRAIGKRLRKWLEE